MKPISYLKSHAAEVILDLGEGDEPLVITQNGEAKAVVQDIRSYEQTQETLALLKILEIGKREIEEGRTIRLREAMRRVRERRGKRSKRPHG